jgi:hypothetical protein
MEYKTKLQYISRAAELNARERETDRQTERQREREPDADESFGRK